MKLKTLGCIAALMVCACSVLAEEKSHFGGCILMEPDRAVPEDVYQNTGVFKTDDYPPFTKALVVGGLTLVAADEAPNDFMELVAQTTVEMFPQDEGMDLKKQAEILQNHYIYNAVIPVPNFASFSEHIESDAIVKLSAENSICDIIMYGSHGQVMEVVEHILHYVNDIGLNYAYPDEWGMSRTSDLYKAMQKAIDKGYYDVRGYQEIKDRPEEYLRLILQEFGYWFITTAWNLQEPYGPNEDEWTIKNREELKEKLPEMFAVMENTVDRVMKAPSLETLQKIGPLRKDEN